MISPEFFVSTLKNSGFHFFTGVPCSFFQSAINCVQADEELNYVIAANEGSALALAAGAYLAGDPAVVMLQNSGLGNLINPLTSLNMIYNLPALIFVSGRAYGVEDEPQHEIIGKTMGGMLQALGVRYADLPQEPEEFEEALKKAQGQMTQEHQPYVFFVRKGTIGSFAHKPDKGPYPLSRVESIDTVRECLDGSEYVVATTGMPSRELFMLDDKPRYFYMQGSMGHAASIALGIALQQPQKKVIVLDGDGAVLMHMGMLSTIGHYQPKNLVHIVLDNEAYETTGNQNTTSSTTDFCLMAKASGYRNVDQAMKADEIRTKLKKILKTDGPSFLRIKINRTPAGDVPRISGKYTSAQIADNFRKAMGDES